MPKQDIELDRWLKGLSQIVGEVLWRDWDPMDVNEDVTHVGIYDEHIPGVLRLLLNDAEPSEVADLLWKIEEEDLQLSISQADTVDAANMLVNEAHIFMIEHPKPSAFGQ
ncbi:hypothetical protein [Hirschia litorea]|uniref:PH domain-containing protein n=1 Tax=Hirschia litorea TaxID=1199156 RepID=A0ABW2IH82_9PROT